MSHRCGSRPGPTANCPVCREPGPGRPEPGPPLPLRNVSQSRIDGPWLRLGVRPPGVPQVSLPGPAKVAAGGPHEVKAASRILAHLNVHIPHFNWLATDNNGVSAHLTQSGHTYFCYDSYKHAIIVSWSCFSHGGRRAGFNKSDCDISSDFPRKGSTGPHVGCLTSVAIWVPSALGRFRCGRETAIRSRRCGLGRI